MQCARWETGRIEIIVVYYDCLLLTASRLCCPLSGVTSVACCVAVPGPGCDSRFQNLNMIACSSVCCLAPTMAIGSTSRPSCPLMPPPSASSMHKLSSLCPGTSRTTRRSPWHGRTGHDAGAPYAHSIYTNLRYTQEPQLF